MAQPLPNNMAKINPATTRLLIICFFILTVGCIYWLSYKFNPNALGIDAQKGWQRTGVFVQQGDRVTIKVINGSWSGGVGYSTGDGRMGECKGGGGCEALLANFPKDELIAEIGDQPFGIGHSAWLTAPQDGEFFYE